MAFPAPSPLLLIYVLAFLLITVVGPIIIVLVLLLRKKPKKHLVEKKKGSKLLKDTASASVEEDTNIKNQGTITMDTHHLCNRSIKNSIEGKWPLN